ncbi:MAG TPA: PAS domain-containing protein [Clostridia bacterium]|nr:PAS domain-containing protein [Clostridia bacterium]
MDDHFLTLFKYSPIPMYWWRLTDATFDPVLVDFNDAASEMTGGRIQELIGTRCSAMYADDERIRDDFRVAFHDKRTVRRTLRYRLRSTGQVGSFNASYIFIAPDSVIVAVLPL